LLAFTGGLFEGYREVSEQLFQLDDAYNPILQPKTLSFLQNNRHLMRKKTKKKENKKKILIINELFEWHFFCET